MKNLYAANVLSVTIVGTSSAGMACLWLLDASAKSLILLTIGAVACWLLPRASAATRHWVWATTMLGLMIIPVATLLLPEWHILPSWLSIESRIAESSRIDKPFPNELPAAPNTSTVPLIPTNEFDIASLGKPDSEPPVPAFSQASEQNWPLVIRVNADLLLAVWATGVVLLLAPIVLAFFRLNRLERQSSRYGALGQRFVARVAKAAGDLGVSPPQIIVGPPGAMPMVWSFGRGRLLLPSNCEQWLAQMSAA